MLYPFNFSNTNFASIYFVSTTDMLIRVYIQYTANSPYSTKVLFILIQKKWDSSEKRQASL